MVLDASDSMSPIREAVIQVADNQIKNLATRSQEMDQETRATVYTFSSRGKTACAFYDKDVLRLPSIDHTYRTNFGGMTALVDATIKAIEDLKQSATLYGDHTFVVYVLTDGFENDSYKTGRDLRNVLQNLPDSWTVGILVPSIDSVAAAKALGFSAQNVQRWDPTYEGIQEVGRTLTVSTTNYMQARSDGSYSATGGRNYSLFSVDPANLTTKTVSNLQRIQPADVLTVHREAPISEFVSHYRGSYTKGEAFYQLSKKETIQSGKQVMVRDKTTGEFYGGREARGLLGIPDYEIRVAPTDHPKYDIFVQSTSSNRKLVPGTEVLVV